MKAVSKFTKHSATTSGENALHITRSPGIWCSPVPRWLLGCSEKSTPIPWELLLGEPYLGIKISSSRWEKHLRPKEPHPCAFHLASVLRPTLWGPTAFKTPLSCLGSVNICDPWPHLQPLPLLFYCDTDSCGEKEVKFGEWHQWLRRCHMRSEIHT